LPFQDPLIDSLDFVSLADSPQILKEKILKFNEILEIIPKTSLQGLCEEINNLAYSNIDWVRLKSQGSSLYMWDILRCNNYIPEKQEQGQSLLNKVFSVAHSLSTSSACIEQSFSCLKLVKNLLRSSLREETTQSLMIISQEFRDKPIVITQEMLTLYEKIKSELNSRKT